MSLINFFSRHIIAPASDKVLDRSIFSKLKFLEQSQWWSRDELVDYQNQRLQKMVAFAYREVPFYKNLFDTHGIRPVSIRTADDLKNLPILQKKDIRKIFGERNKPSSSYIPMISSGSTGEPLQYSVSSDAFSMHYASAIRGWEWMGYKLGDRYLKISQHPRDNWMKKLQDFALRSKFFYMPVLSDEHFEELYGTIKDYDPAFLRSYPDPLMFFGKYLEKNELPPPTFKAINTTGNILYPEAITKIKSITKSSVYDHYRCEGSSMFCQLKPEGCYYGADEYAITEIVDEDGNNVQPGEKGRLVTTDLWNREVPFIRYDTQDVVTKASNTHNHELEHTAIEKIDGRDCDILITPDQRLLIVHNFTIYFESILSVTQFKVIQEKIDFYRFILKVNKTFDLETEIQIKKDWEKKIGNGVIIDIEVVEEIDPTASGKRRFLERNSSISIPI